METRRNAYKDLLKVLLKDFSTPHTITSLAKELKMSRVGMWKILKKLEQIKYITLTPLGTGKTSTYTINLNWENVLVEKALVLYLTEDSIKEKRWMANFAELETEIEFLLLYGSILTSPQHAHDIDILGIAKKKNFIKIQQVIETIQKTQSKKIHSLNFTEEEFKAELNKPNKAFIEAVKKGVILFGQENFVRFMRKMTK